MKAYSILIIAVALLTFPFLLTGNTEKTEYGKVYKTDGPTVTRSEAILLADRYARLHYYMNDNNRRSDKCGCNFTSQYSIGPRIGVGYKWNDWTELEEFKRKIEEGYGTGTGGYVEYTEYPFDCTVGVSCTGLVSRAWKLNNKYTLDYPDNPGIPRQFDDITFPLDGFDFLKPDSRLLKMGDAFMNPSHIMLYVYETRDGQPMVIDSRYWGVRFRKENWKVLHDTGYRAIRYYGINDDAMPSRSLDNPGLLTVTDLPCKIDGNTLNIVSMNIDRYGMVPERNEEGPENIFLLRFKKSIKLIIELNDLKEESIDNSLFLLSSLKLSDKKTAVDCLAFGDSTIEFSFSAGEYYLVIDSGDDLPGEYTLRLSVIE